MRDKSFYSKDPFLLMRLYTDLILHGHKEDREWNESLNPFMPLYISGRLDSYLHIEASGIRFHNHGVYSTPYELTEKNYLKHLKSLV